MEKLKDIVAYRERNNLISCIDDKRDCPCRIFYHDFPLCDFPKHYAVWSIAQRSYEVDHLLESICLPRRNEVLQWRFISGLGSKNVQDFFSKVKVGDKVYCTTELSDVIYLEKDTPPYGWVRYKSFDGEIKVQPPECFRNISKGEKFAIFRVKNQKDSLILEIVELKARELGFRVEKVGTKGSFMLRIYGDTQVEVDEFVNTCFDNILSF